MSKDELRTRMLEWMKVNYEVEQLQSILREKKKQRKSLEAYLETNMIPSNPYSAAGQIVTLEQTVKRSGYTKKYMMKKFREFFHEDTLLPNEQNELDSNGLPVSNTARLLKFLSEGRTETIINKISILKNTDAAETGTNMAETVKEVVV